MIKCSTPDPFLYWRSGDLPVYSWHDPALPFAAQHLKPSKSFLCGMKGQKCTAEFLNYMSSGKAEPAVAFSGPGVASSTELRPDPNSHRWSHIPEFAASGDCSKYTMLNETAANILVFTNLLFAPRADVIRAAGVLLSSDAMEAVRNGTAWLLVSDGPFVRRQLKPMGVRVQTIHARIGGRQAKFHDETAGHPGSVMAYSSRAADKLLERLNTVLGPRPMSVWYIASDSLTVKKEMLNRLPPHAMALELEFPYTLHLSKDHLRGDHEDDPVVSKTFAEFLFLSCGHAAVRSTSGFSRVPQVSAGVPMGMIDEPTTFTAILPRTMKGSLNAPVPYTTAFDYPMHAISPAERVCKPVKR